MFMLKEILTIIASIFIISSFAQKGEDDRRSAGGNIIDKYGKPVSYAHIRNKSQKEGCIGDLYGNFHTEVFPGDSLEITAVSYCKVIILIPEDFSGKHYPLSVIMFPDTVLLKEIAVHPWPATYSQLRKRFLEVEVEDPAEKLDLHLPSCKDIAAMNRTPGEPGQIGLYSGTSPISLLYNIYSHEARSKKLYAKALNYEKAEKRYNRSLVRTVTRLKNEDDITKFMEFCALQVKFILESTDYELYAAILNCYNEFCESGFRPSEDDE